VDIFKKIGKTAKSTASTIGTKSVELMNTGKLMMEKNNLKGKITSRFKDIGSIIYKAHKDQISPDEEKIIAICQEIDDLEVQIADIEQKVKEEKEKSKKAQETTYSENASETEIETPQEKVRESPTEEEEEDEEKKDS